MLARNEIRVLYEQIDNSVANNGKQLNPAKNMNNHMNRLWVLWLIIFAIIFIILARVFYLITLQSDFLNKQLNTRIFRTVYVKAIRGQILDRDGEPLAISTPVSSIWIDPTQIDGLTKTQVEKLANILNMNTDELNTKFNQKNKTFVYLKRAVSPSQELAIKNLDIAGVYTIPEFKRYYPYADVTSHVIGFNSVDDKGVEGIEYANNKNLTGIDGKAQITQDRRGNIIDKSIVLTQPKNGNKIVLSIDNKIQYIAYSALKEQVSKFNADGGSAIVLDAKTGEVLAMVNMPTYNPNNLKNVTLDAIRNRAAVDIFEPGSIIKPLIVAKALDGGIVKSSTVFDTHQYVVGRKLIKDDHSYPSLSVTDIIKHSSDIGASKIALKLDKKDMWSYYSSLGFGQKIGSHFPGEATGIFRNWQKWYPIDQAEMGFGYGISLSLMQMARGYSIFTNDGCILPISFYKLDANPSCTQVIKPQVAREMRKILGLVNTDGTGKSAQLNDYTSAGKTGTAQKYSKVHGYNSRQYHASFVGFAPVDNPRVIVAVTIDNPKKNSYYGSAVTAPIFAEITNPILHLLNVTPDKK
jgi:cell division protein FtsI (penicillin-binding protein 3)